MKSAQARKLKHYLQEAAKILKAETPEAQLQDFESIELAARQHIVETVGPVIGEIFFAQESQEKVGKSDR